MTRLCTAITALLLSVGLTPAHAADAYPAKPITIIYPLSLIHI